MHATPRALILAAVSLLTACVGSNNPAAGGGTVTATPTLNVVSLSIDSGPTGAPGQFNHAYVTVRVCTPGSTSQCANIDHVLIDTGSSGLRLVRSVLTAAGVTLPTALDASGQSIEECVSFGGGQTWGPVASADVALAGETAAALPVQILDDTGTGAPPPANCGARGTLINGVSGFGANGLLGIGVFRHDCGAGCVNAATPQPIYFGCSAAGTCAAENLALSAQVTNPVAAFPVDNTGVIIELPNLINANGDLSAQGQMIIGIATQTDNAMPATGLTVLGTDSGGNFTTAYNGGASLPASIDSGTEDYAFEDPTIAVCAAGAFVGYYCPAVAPLAVYAVNVGVGANSAANTVDFAIADPNTFAPNASALPNLGGGGSSGRFTWGMPFFYGRNVYVGINQRVAGLYTGPFFAY